MSMLLHLCVVPVVAQNRQEDEQRHKRAIIINAEQPNVWTLEQAHYLLAQMHRRNLDLKATGLGDLDPNEINGLNFEVMRTLLEFGVAFNDADRFNNSLLKTRKSFDADRAIRLQTRRDQLADGSLGMSRDIARLEHERALAKSQEDKDELAAAIAERTAVRDGIDKEVARLDENLKTAGGPTGELQATEPPPPADASRLPQSTFDDAFKDVTRQLIERFNQAPKLNATLRLDNFLQLQYEIIAKQLTLLRDEVGPGQRIVFLELPQTVNATYDKANNKWAQSWWKIVAYTEPMPKPTPTPRPWPSPSPSPSPDTSDPQQIQYSQLETRDVYTQSGRQIEVKEYKGRRVQVEADPTRNTKQIVEDAIDAITHNGTSSKVIYHSLDAQLDAQTPAGGVMPEDPSVRTVELIPRQSSLNVNDIKLRARSGALTAVARTLFGFGARLNFQRQRESFSQFVQQELYSSAFGKGSREFGWTFTPMPGTDRVLSGVRTTYAVLVVPEEAETLVLQTSGCYFPRSEYQPNNFASTADSRWNDSDRQSRNCTGRRAFVVPIPGGGGTDSNDFWVNALDYIPAPKSGRVVLSIYGKNFSSQTGVMVDGVPLTQAIGLGQPLIRDDSLTGAATVQDLKDSSVQGRIERVAPDQIVAVFERPGGKDGTPVITLTSPGKAQNLNRLVLRINSKQDTTLDDSPFMFGRKPEEREGFRIDKVEVFRGRTPGYLTAAVSGAGFASGQEVFVNGTDAGLVSDLKSGTLLTVRFPVPFDDAIRVTIVRSDDTATADKNEEKTIESDSVPNPARLSVANVSVVSFEDATEEEPATLVVKIEGFGFTDDLQATTGEGADKKILDVAVRSATEALLKITDPEAAAVVSLEDTKTGLKTKFIVTRKTSPPK
jgi:hypothetical protein